MVDAFSEPRFRPAPDFLFDRAIALCRRRRRIENVVCLTLSTRASDTDKIGKSGKPTGAATSDLRWSGGGANTGKS